MFLAKLYNGNGYTWAMKNLVSIIVVNYNGRHLLQEAFESIYSAIKGINAEVILLDNNSTDGSIDFARKNFRKIKIAKNSKNLGYSGINNALPHCKGDFIVFLNNDIMLDNKCIKIMLDLMQSDNEIFQAAPGLVNYYDKSLKSGGTWLSRAFYNGHIKGSGKEKTREIPYLGVGMLRKEYFSHFNYIFDPDYFIYAEDVDLGLRIRLIGKKVVFAPDAVLYHKHSATMQNVQDSRKTFLLERNLLTTFLKVMPFSRILLCLPYILAARAVIISGNLLTAKFGIASARIKAIIWVLANLSRILKKRSEVQALRKAGSRHIMEIFSEKYLFSGKFIV